MLALSEPRGTIGKVTWSFQPNQPNQTQIGVPVKVSTRTLRAALEETLMQYTRSALELVLAEELNLAWSLSTPASSEDTKRELICGYIADYDLRALVGLTRRVVAELDTDASRLQPLLDAYDRGGGVGTPAKNLIFAANGPKPDLVLRDAVNNDIEIVRNAEYCLVYDRPVPADGLHFSHLIDWWREREGLGSKTDDREVGRALHRRLRTALDGNGAEQKVFDRYAQRYKESFDIPALIPQVYLHYDPQTQMRRARSGGSGPLPRQRMDFLILFSTRHRVVLEVDGKQHYAEGATASPTLYAEMVSEDRRLRLDGYEIYRFGGAELVSNSADVMLDDFFAQLATKMR